MDVSRVVCRRDGVPTQTIRHVLSTVDVRNIKKIYFKTLKTRFILKIKKKRV